MADYPDDYYYLDPDFDVNQLTIPKIRSILLKHNVGYPPSGKKSVLIDLLNEHVLPQRVKLLRSQARTKPSTRGIQDVPSSQSSSVDDEDQTLVPSPSTRRTSRRTRGGTEEVVQRTVAPTPRKIQSVVPTKHDRTLDVEVDELPPTRRSRHSMTPAVKREPSEPESWHKHTDDSPFSNENPFQSGSSPPVASAKALAKNQRRKTTGVVEQRDKRKSDAHRRRTGQPSVQQFDDGIVVPSRSSFEIRSTQYPQELDSVEAGEEFTAEEQLELVREKARSGQADILPPRRRKQPSKALGTLKAGAWAMTLAALIGFAGVWRQQKLAVGYCGMGKEPTSLAGVDIPEWADVLLPQCEPCPPHAYCYRDLKTECEQDFVLKHHPLSFNSLIPLPPTCEPDSEKARRITAVTDKTVDILRKRRAKYECGEVDSAGKVVKSPEIGEAELKEELSSMKRRGMSQEDFDALWKNAIGEVKAKDEVEQSTDKITGERLLTSTSYVGLSLSCAFKRWLRESFERHFRQLASVVAFAIVALYSWISYTSSRQMEARAKHLASNVFDRLANHAALNSSQPGAYPDLGISMAQLRDDILRTEFSTTKRRKLWEKVQKKVENNANVRAAVREGHGGDIARMWEWVGPVQLFDDGRSTGRRESRYSLGAAIASSPPKELKSLGWDEGRPIY